MSQALLMHSTARDSCLAQPIPPRPRLGAPLYTSAQSGAGPRGLGEVLWASGHEHVHQVYLQVHLHSLEGLLPEEHYCTLLGPLSVSG